MINSTRAYALNYAIEFMDWPRIYDIIKIVAENLITFSDGRRRRYSNLTCFELSPVIQILITNIVIILLTVLCYVR